MCQAVDEMIEDGRREAAVRLFSAKLISESSKGLSDKPDSPFIH